MECFTFVQNKKTSLYQEWQLLVLTLDNFCYQVGIIVCDDGSGVKKYVFNNRKEGKSVLMGRKKLEA